MSFAEPWHPNRVRWPWTAGVIGVLMFVTPLAWAEELPEQPEVQERSPSGSAPSSSLRPWEMDPETLEETGWSFLDNEGRPGRPLAGAVALFPGVLFHGTGHWALQEREIALELLVRQAIGVSGALVAGILRPLASDAPEALGAVHALAVASWGGLAANWVADGFGAFRGTLTGASETTLPPRLQAGAAWTFLTSADARSVSGGQVTLRWDDRHARSMDPSGPWIQMQADVTAESVWTRLLLDAGWALGLGPGAQSTVALRLRASEEAFDGWSSGRSGLEPGVAFRLEFGDRLPHLRGLYWETRAGVNLSWWWFESENTARFRSDNRHVRVPSETEIGLDVGSQLELSLLYRERYDTVVGRMGRLGPFDNVGSFVGRLQFGTFQRVAVLLQVEVGQATRLLLGASLWMPTRSRDADIR